MLVLKHKPPQNKQRKYLKMPQLTAENTATSTVTENDLANEMAALKEMSQADGGYNSPEDKVAVEQLAEETREKFKALNRQGSQIAIQSTLGEQPAPVAEKAPQMSRDELISANLGNVGDRWQMPKS